jgi:hypothetical protein
MFERLRNTPRMGERLIRDRLHLTERLMPYELTLSSVNGAPADAVDPEELRRRIEQLLDTHAPRFRRLWMYYRNPMMSRTAERDEQGADRPYRQAQEWGLPSRVTGVRVGSSSSFTGQPVDGVARKEVVIENDIAWRIDTMIDFLFGKPITVRSTVKDSARREQIETLLKLIINHNGGATMLQHIALLGSVHGFVDLLVKLEAGAMDGSAPFDAGPAPRAESADAEPHLDDDQPAGEIHAPPSPSAPLARIARAIRLEIVEPARALPVLSDIDWRNVRAYVQVYQVPRRTPSSNRVARRFGFLKKLFSTDETCTVVEILTATSWQRYEDEKLVASGVNSLGELPLVHIQNLAVPFEYAGTSDVEVMIPIQDELNTRLSDRANRITLQCFKMYLGKGIDGFTQVPIAPGRMWATDNPDAQVIEFGGDSRSPSEDHHITELREAMDKVSGVTPIAAGAIRGRIGHLTSAAALRVTMMALIAKTQRKRLTYGQAIARMCELSLSWLDRAGLFATYPDERQVEIEWSDVISDLTSDSHEPKEDHSPSRTGRGQE